MRILCGVLLLLAGCSNHRATEKAKELKEEICKCSDRACADNGLNEFRNWFAEHMPQGTRDDAEVINAAYRDAEECARKLRLRADAL
jgi:hypothetical protein